jgi:hypothetical protein
MITALIIPNLIKIGIFIDFKINQDFISEVLCINKEKPMSTCNGKCFLAQKLKKAEEQEKKQAPSTKKERLDFVYYQSKSSVDCTQYSELFVSKLNTACTSKVYEFNFIQDIFHPPKLNLI